jgi:hypothetical protein
VTVVALTAATLGCVTAVWWLVAFKHTVRQPGTALRPERHHLMATGGFAFGICGSLALAELGIISWEWATTVSSTIVAATMLWRIWLLRRAQQQRGKHEQR